MANTKPQPAGFEHVWNSSHLGHDTKDGFYAHWGKRLFDVVMAAVGLISLWPLFLVVGLISKCSSQGPVFYRQQRVGRNCQIFFILKFRTMIMEADLVGLGITAKGDPRITPFGRWLRLFKIDELPQLWNVLKGEMSLVGPRPELLRYVAGYTELQRQVLSVRPGITDPASLAYRHEERALAGSPDPERHYLETILPHKLELNMEYLDQISLTRDLSLIFRTLQALFRSSS